MKKLITIFCSFSFVFSSSTTAISCLQINKGIIGHQEKYGDKNKHQNQENELLEAEEDIITSELKKGIDGSHLTVNNTITDAFDLIQNDVLIDCPDAEDIKLVNKDKMNENLKVDKNYIDVSFKIKNHNKKITSLIKDVKNVDKSNIVEDYSVAKQKIEQMFKLGLDGSHFYAWNTIFDALTYFQNEAKKINPKANVKFSDKYIMSRLGKKMFEKLAKEEIKIKNNSSSKSSHSKKENNKNKKNHKLANLNFPLSKIFSAKKMIMALSNGGSATTLGTAAVALGWASAAVAVGATSYFFATWISKKMSNVKRTKETFLTKETEEFELELFFENNLEKEFSDKNDNNNDNNKTKFHTTLRGIKPRSNKSAKKIIEDEIYTFNHPLTFKATLAGVEQHIKAKMFPTVLDSKSKHQFELKAKLKNPKQNNHKLKKGLNKIKVVLKPQKSNLTNFFKKTIGAGNIDVVINANYKVL